MKSNGLADSSTFCRVPHLSIYFIYLMASLWPHRVRAARRLVCNRLRSEPHFSCAQCERDYNLSTAGRVFSNSPAQRRKSIRQKDGPVICGGSKSREKRRSSVTITRFAMSLCGAIHTRQAELFQGNQEPAERKTERNDHGGMKPFCLDQETGLKPAAARSVPKRQGVCVRRNEMTDAAMAVLGLFSVGIFLVHAVDAYRAH